MNSIERLAKERGGAIEALSLIGLSASWIGALAAHPALFKQYLRDQKRISAKVVHPEPNQTELSNKAGDIYPAFDLLEATDDDSLAKAMREFADKFSVPRVEVLNLIATLKSGKEQAEAQLKNERELHERRALNAQKPANQDSNSFISLLESQFKKPEDLPADLGETVHLSAIGGMNFSTELMIDGPQGAEMVATITFFNINDEGYVSRTTISQIFEDNMSTQEIKKAIFALVPERLSLKGNGIPIGKAIGFVQSYTNVQVFETPFFPAYDRASPEEKTREASAKEFIKEYLNYVTPTGIFIAPAKNDTLSLHSSYPLMGLVTLQGYDRANDKVTFSVVYIHNFLDGYNERT